MSAFFTSRLLSCSVACHIASCILRVCFSVCLCLSWPETFWKKINRIYKQGFSGVSKETSPILARYWILALQIAPNWTDREKSFASLTKKWITKRIRKVIGVAKRYALTLKGKNLQKFLKHLCFNNVYSTGAILMIV